MKAIAALVCLAGLSGCATAPRQAAPIADSRSYAAPFDKVWGLLVASVAEKGYPIQAIEKQSGIITTKPIEVRPESAWRNIPVILGEIGDKPFTPCLGAWNEAHYTLTIYATESAGATTVKVKTLIEGVDGCNVKHEIPSKGKLEGDLLQAVSLKA